MINIKSLTVRYKSLVAVNNLSLHIKSGEIFGLLGPNGAGKTTTFKILAGLMVPDAGEVAVNNCDIIKDKNKVKSITGYMADFFGVYEFLTIYEYLSFFGGLYGLTGNRLEQQVNKMLILVKLESKKHDEARTLSRGMKQRLYFARALIHDPELLILDEPASGLDPLGRKDMFDALKNLNREGKTILISSHILNELQGVCTSVGFIEKGTLTSVKSLEASIDKREKRKVVVLVNKNDTARAESFINGYNETAVIEKRGNSLVFETVDSDDTVSEIVKNLVGSGIRVLLPNADRPDLEEIFFKATKGQTQ